MVPPLLSFMILPGGSLESPGRTGPGSLEPRSASARDSFGVSYVANSKMQVCLHIRYRPERNQRVGACSSWSYRVLPVGLHAAALAQPRRGGPVRPPRRRRGIMIDPLLPGVPRCSRVSHSGSHAVAAYTLHCRGAARPGPPPDPPGRRRSLPAPP